MEHANPSADSRTQDDIIRETLSSRIEEDMASLYSDFLNKFLTATLGTQSSVIEDYISERFDVRARWYLLLVQNEQSVEPYLACLGSIRQEDIESVIMHFAGSLKHRALVDARIVARISYWKSEAMRRVREKLVQAAGKWRGQSAVASAEAKAVADAPTQPTLTDPPLQATEQNDSDVAAEIETDGRDPEDIKRGKIRSAWLDQKLIQHKVWTSDTDIAANSGPSYNTIRRYRSGALSTRELYVRRQFGKAFKCDATEVPE